MTEYNVYSATCPTRQMLERLGDKWALLVMNLLMRKTTRFNEIRRSIEGVSQKMLSQTLKNLERDGLVTRTVYPTVPVTVEYALTPLGSTLNSAIDALRVWTENNMDQILEAQKKYDGA